MDRRYSKCDRRYNVSADLVTEDTVSWVQSVTEDTYLGCNVTEDTNPILRSEILLGPAIYHTLYYM